jgi:hypothetical protein
MSDITLPEEVAIALATRRTRVVLALGGGQQERLDDDMPIVGSLRLVTSYRRGTGGDNFVVPAAQVVKLCQHDPARIAGNLQNIGANPLFVYLGVPADVVQGNATSMVCLFLAANGIWDFKLSNDVWCGPVSLFSTLGTTVVWGTH